MPYKTGSWGEQAKLRSKRRLEYFRKHAGYFGMYGKKHSKESKLRMSTAHKNTYLERRENGRNTIT